MILDPSLYKVNTQVDSFKNSTIINQTFSVDAYTFPSGDGQLLSYSIPIVKGTTISQIKANLSYDLAKWHVLPLIRFNVYAPSASTSMQMFANYSSERLIVTLVIVPVGVAPWSYPAFTFTIGAKIFIVPSNF